MLQGDVLNAARALDAAEQARTQMRHLSTANPGMTVPDAYAIQAAWVGAKLERGRSVIGHKIGLTSRAMQQAVNIGEPDYGVLLDDMLFHDGAVIAFDRFIEPRVEVELAFILARPLRGPDCTLFDVLNATDFVSPALEIIDARIERIDRQTGATRTVLDTISDNAANAGVVLGGRPIRPLDEDLRWVAALMYKNAGIEETGVAAGVLNHPANGIAWLANRLCAYGVGLEAGQVILAGSFTRPTFIARGDTIHADYGRLGAITCQFC